MPYIFRFPFLSQPEIAKQWINNVNMGRYVCEPSKKSVLCSDHFEDSCFDRTGKNVLLKPGSIPTIFSKSRKLPEQHRALHVPPLAVGTEALQPSTSQEVPVATFKQELSAEGEQDPQPLTSQEGATCTFEQELSEEGQQDPQPSTSPEGARSTCTFEQELSEGQQDPQPSTSPEGATFENEPPAVVGEQELQPSTSHEAATCAHASTREHHYYVSPRIIKRKFTTATEKSSGVRKKLRLARQTVKRLKKKVNSLHEVVDALRSKRMVSDNAADVIQKTFFGASQSLMLRMLKNSKSGKITRESYPPILRSFALTLQFYSNKAYEYVRKTFNLALPHPSVLRSWYTGIDCQPGFSKEAFTALQLKVEEVREKGKKVICSLAIDEMAIRKHVEWDGEKFVGYVDFGTEVNDDDLPIASEALVFLLVSLDSHWKLPVGYFLIHSLSGEERANLVQECLTKLYYLGVSVTSLTCDGPSCHFTMSKHLGANFQLPDVVPYFTHPADDSQKVYILLDVCHMLKLVRNTWAFLGAFKDDNGNLIKWDFITALHELQESEGFRAGTKLRVAHIQFQKQKMKVNLAAQTISSSIADALEFCSKDLKLPKFQGCEATVKFIQTFDRLFDLLNSRNPCAKGYKAGMRVANECHWRPFAEEAVEYIQKLTDPKGTPMHLTPRKTPFIGFIISTKSAVMIYDAFVAGPSPSLKYLLTYKLSQDHLELFFSAIRQRGGWNNNPTARQFISAYKRLLVHHEVSSNGGNVAAQDQTKILYVTRDSISRSTGTRDVTDISDITAIRRYDLLVSSPLEADHDYADIPVPEFDTLGEYVENVVGHIAGYVVLMVEKKIHCDECLQALRDDGTTTCGFHRLVKRKTRGGLVIPSSGVVQVCLCAERCFRRMLHKTQGKLPQTHSFIPSLCLAVLEEIVSKAVPAFPSLEEHMFDSTPDSNHTFRLIKVVAACFARIRLFHLGKKETEKVKGDMIRKKLSKLILFRHQ